MQLANSVFAAFVDDFVFCAVLVFNYFSDVLLGQQSKAGSVVFASSLKVSNLKFANLK